MEEKTEKVELKGTGNEVCPTCGQHVRCRQICPHCGIAPCEVRGVHEKHGHKNCHKNSELPAHWGGPVTPIYPPYLTPVISHVGQIPDMGTRQAQHQHVSPPNPPVVQQGEQPPDDLPETVLKELGLEKKP